MSVRYFFGDQEIMHIERVTIEPEPHPEGWTRPPALPKRVSFTTSMVASDCVVDWDALRAVRTGPMPAWAKQIHDVIDIAPMIAFRIQSEFGGVVTEENQDKVKAAIVEEIEREFTIHGMYLWFAEDDIRIDLGEDGKLTVAFPMPPALQGMLRPEPD